MQRCRNNKEGENNTKSKLTDPFHIFSWVGLIFCNQRSQRLASRASRKGNAVVIYRAIPDIKMRRHLTGRSLASETVDEIFDVEIFALIRSVAPSLPWLFMCKSCLGSTRPTFWRWRSCRPEPLQQSTTNGRYGSCCSGGLRPLILEHLLVAQSAGQEMFSKIRVYSFRFPVTKSSGLSGTTESIRRSQPKAIYLRGKSLSAAQTAPDRRATQS